VYFHVAGVAVEAQSINPILAERGEIPGGRRFHSSHRLYEARDIESLDAA